MFGGGRDGRGGDGEDWVGVVGVCKEHCRLEGGFNRLYRCTVLRALVFFYSPVMPVQAVQQYLLRLAVGIGDVRLIHSKISVMPGWTSDEPLGDDPIRVP